MNRESAQHWSEAYLGMPYVTETFDCGVLAERVRREVFGHDLKLPSERRPGPYGRAIQLRMHLPDFCAPTSNPKDGDAVLIIAKGRSQHIGIYCVIPSHHPGGSTATPPRAGGEGWVLHNVEASSVHRIRVRDLAKWGYQVEGYYKWI